MAALEVAVPEVRAHIDIPAEPTRVYELAKDVEGFPDFLPNVQEVVVRERVQTKEPPGERTVTEWVGLVPEFRRTIRWREEDVWDDTALTCQFRCLSGDWDKYQGSWSFRPEGDGTRAELSIEYEYNVPLIGALIKQLLRKLVQRNAEETLEGLRRRASGEG